MQDIALQVVDIRPITNAIPLQVVGRGYLAKLVLTNLRATLRVGPGSVRMAFKPYSWPLRSAAERAGRPIQAFFVQNRGFLPDPRPSRVGFRSVILGVQRRLNLHF